MADANTEFSGLQSDVAALISASTSTIQQLVDRMATMAGAAGAVSPGDGTSAANFISQVQSLRTQVQDAIKDLQSRASTALNKPVGGSVGGSVGGTGDQIAVTPVNPVDATAAAAAPGAGTTIGPDTFKAAG